MKLFKKIRTVLILIIIGILTIVSALLDNIKMTTYCLLMISGFLLAGADNISLEWQPLSCIAGLIIFTIGGLGLRRELEKAER